MKSGFKTSEFWLRALAKIFGAALAFTGMMQPSPITQAIAIIAGAGLGLLSLKGYGEERTDLKLADMAERATLARLAAVAPVGPQTPPSAK